MFRDLFDRRLGHRQTDQSGRFLILSAERAVYSIWVLVTIAAGILIYSLMTGDYRMAYVAHYTNRAMPLRYKYTAWWGGQEGSLLFWNWLLASYGAVVVFRNQRKFREMMPWVVAVMMATQVFFLTLIVFIESPFKVLMAGQARHGRRRRPGLERAASILDDDHSSSDAVSGLCRIRGAVRFRDRVADHQAAGRGVDPCDAALDSGDLDVPDDRSSAGRGLGLRGAGMGRLLGLGSGGERIAAAVDHGDGVSAFRDDAGEKRNDEGVEHGAGLGHVLPLHFRNVPYAQRHCELGARVFAGADRDVLCVCSSASESRRR